MMPHSVQHDLSWSSRAFVEQVWPIVKQWVGGEVSLVESVRADGFVRDLDTLAGIDAWHIVRAREQMRGIASRVQRVDRPYATFTVRMSRDSGAVTEFEKRVAAIKDGWLYPHLTTQAYIANADGRLLSVGMARTRDVLAMIQQSSPGVCVRRTVNAAFYVVPWGTLRDANLPFREWGEQGGAG